MIVFGLFELPPIWPENRAFSEQLFSVHNLIATRLLAFARPYHGVAMGPHAAFLSKAFKVLSLANPANDHFSQKIGNKPRRFLILVLQSIMLAKEIGNDI